MIDELTDFLWEHCTYLHERNKKETLREAVEKHLSYATIVWTHDEKGIRGVCRFNVTGSVSDILDVAVRPDQRKKEALRELLLIGINLYPNVKQLHFNSIDKGREFITPVSLILKEK